MATTAHRKRGKHDEDVDFDFDEDITNSPRFHAKKPSTNASHVNDDGKDENIGPHIAGLLVLIRKLYLENAISLHHRNLLKDAILDCDPFLILSFRSFVANGDKETLVDALIKVCARGIVAEGSGPRSSETRPAPKPVTDSPDHKGIDVVGLKLKQAEARSLLLKTQLHKIGLREIWSIFDEDAPLQTITHSNFLSHLPALAQSPDVDTKFLVSFLNQLFQLMDRGEEDSISVSELLCGLSLLCRAPLQLKLQSCFGVMCSDGDMMSQEELLRFTYSCSVVLHILLQPSSEIPIVNQRDQVWERAKVLFAEAEFDPEEGVTFEQFMSWKTNPVYIAHELIGELLDS